MLLTIAVMFSLVNKRIVRAFTWKIGKIYTMWYLQLFMNILLYQRIKQLEPYVNDVSKKPETAYQTNILSFYK